MSTTIISNTSVSLPSITYEAILAEIRRHRNDTYIGKGKWNADERLADHLLAMFNAHKIYYNSTPISAYPVSSVKEGSPLAGSLADTPASISPAPK